MGSAKFTQHERNQIAIDYLNGMTATSVAAKYGCVPHYPNLLIKRMGIRRDPKYWLVNSQNKQVRRKLIPYMGKEVFNGRKSSS